MYSFSLIVNVLVIPNNSVRDTCVFDVASANNSIVFTGSFVLESIILTFTFPTVESSICPFISSVFHSSEAPSDWVIHLSSFDSLTDFKLAANFAKLFCSITWLTTISSTFGTSNSLISDSVTFSATVSCEISDATSSLAPLSSSTSATTVSTAASEADSGFVVSCAYTTEVITLCHNSTTVANTDKSLFIFFRIIRIKKAAKYKIESTSFYYCP